MTGKLGGNSVLLTDQNHRDAPLASRHDGTGNFRTRSVITPHSVDCNNDAPAQPVRPLFFYSADFFALVGSAGRAGAMRLLGLFALRAERQPRRLESIVGATHVAFRFGCFLLGNCHDRPFSLGRHQTDRY